jgi:hypothetical protein
LAIRHRPSSCFNGSRRLYRLQPFSARFFPFPVKRPVKSSLSSTILKVQSASRRALAKSKARQTHLSPRIRVHSPGKFFFLSFFLRSPRLRLLLLLVLFRAALWGEKRYSKCGLNNKIVQFKINRKVCNKKPKLNRSAQRKVGGGKRRSGWLG